MNLVMAIVTNSNWTQGNTCLELNLQEGGRLLVISMK